MTQVTDEMVEAGAIAAYFMKVPARSTDQLAQFRSSDAWPVWCATSRATIEAALAAAEPPSPMVAIALNVELKSLQDELDAALRDGNSYVAEDLLQQERALQSTIRQQISLAVADASLRTNDASLRSNAEPPSPGDAEFEAALNEYVGKQIAATRVEANTHRWGGQTPSETEYGKAIITEANVARRHIRDLHRQARQAGLREWLAENRDPLIRAIGNYANLKAVISERDCAGYSTKKYYADAEAEWAKIDAMLQGADGEGEK